MPFEFRLLFLIIQASFIKSLYTLSFDKRDILQSVVKILSNFKKWLRITVMVN